MQPQDHHVRPQCLLNKVGRGLLSAALGLLCVGGLLAADYAPNQPTQFEVEAAYLFNFGKFVTWPPASADTSFLICVLGQDPFGPILDKTVAGETLQGRKVETRRLARPQDAPSCSILYISASEAGRLNKILPVVDETPVLTVSDMPEFAAHGGIIQFVIRDGRVRFQVNLAPTQRDGLTMSSDLLKVAVGVSRGKEGQ